MKALDSLIPRLCWPACSRCCDCAIPEAGWVVGWVARAQPPSPGAGLGPAGAQNRRPPRHLPRFATTGRRERPTDLHRLPAAHGARAPDASRGYAQALTPQPHRGARADHGGAQAFAAGPDQTEPGVWPGFAVLRPIAAWHNAPILTGKRRHEASVHLLLLCLWPPPASSRRAGANGGNENLLWPMPDGSQDRLPEKSSGGMLITEARRPAVKPSRAGARNGDGADFLQQEHARAVQGQHREALVRKLRPAARSQPIFSGNGRKRLSGRALAAALLSPQYKDPASRKSPG